MRLSRRALVLLTTLATLIGANLLISTPAQAATSCSGTITYSESFSYPGEGVIGELTIYYNSSNGGTNSACFYHRGRSYGVATDTWVYIMRCSQTSGEGQQCHSVAAGGYDQGKYAYQAGPVGVTGTANYCVAAVGYIAWHGVTIGPDSAWTRGC
ncbi:hypothetical protein [Streptomyces barringtoniae]|uniref:hypothetical protein n=1 Tax=Streptomyces barringtoniae TaxID=2892029 RepID=UPI001E3CC542|nr:hypothetical protein [Streptomyces barringtoniae]MCC5480185.1 hypothetical protein [Streptomyces barringtoniae]